MHREWFSTYLRNLSWNLLKLSGDVANSYDLNAQLIASEIDLTDLIEYLDGGIEFMGDEDE